MLNKNTQKTYFYHQVPDDMVGKILFPLNRLKELDSKMYNEKFEKYQGRELVTKRINTALDCLWNDTLHMSAINPKDLKEEMYKNNLKKYQVE